MECSLCNSSYRIGGVLERSLAQLQERRVERNECNQKNCIVVLEKAKNKFTPFVSQET